MILVNVIVFHLMKVLVLHFKKNDVKGEALAYTLSCIHKVNWTETDRM